jgi:hypothetical protein
MSVSVKFWLAITRKTEGGADALHIAAGHATSKR